MTRVPSVSSSPVQAAVQGAVTQLVARANAGDAGATDALFPIVYDELRRIAAGYLRKERGEHTLQATALVHEAYVRLLGTQEMSWQNRAHFFGAAAIAIRRILTDHARRRARLKRGGGAVRAEMPDIAAPEQVPSVDLIALDAALDRLAALDEQKARVVQLRFYAGLTVPQAALALGISESTVARDWQFARAWLAREISSGGA